MSRFTQVIQNFFIRLEGFFSVVFRNVFNFFRSIFAFLAKIFGFSNSGYFLESQQAQGIKRETIQPSTETEPATTSETSTSYRRRRPNPQMDYYRKMAQEIKNK